jgi:hypothetical protein
MFNDRAYRPKSEKIVVERSKLFANVSLLILNDTFSILQG